MAKLLIHTGKAKEKVEITPCVCGRMLHPKGATQCVQCGNGLKRKLTFPIKIFCWFWKRQFEEKEEIARMEKRPVFTKPNPPKAMDIVEEIAGIEKRFAFAKSGLIYPYPKDIRLSYPPLPPTTSNPPMPPVEPPIKPKERKLGRNKARVEISVRSTEEAAVQIEKLSKELGKFKEKLSTIKSENENKFMGGLEVEIDTISGIRVKTNIETLEF